MVLKGSIWHVCCFLSKKCCPNSIFGHMWIWITSGKIATTPNCCYRLRVKKAKANQTMHFISNVSFHEIKYEHLMAHSVPAYPKHINTSTTLWWYKFTTRNEMLTEMCHGTCNNAQWHSWLQMHFHSIHWFYTFFGLSIEQSGRWVIISWYAHSSLSVSWITPSKTRTFPYVDDCKRVSWCIYVIFGTNKKTKRLAHVHSIKYLKDHNILIVRLPLK
jgi:hypothetical protein